MTLPVAVSGLSPERRLEVVAGGFHVDLGWLSLLSRRVVVGGSWWSSVGVCSLSDAVGAVGGRINIPGALPISTAASYWAISVAVRIVRAHCPIHEWVVAGILA